ncbi:MAG: hypothetical protein HC801_14150, partial [Nitrospira sp.]|nr:hypothetical protein [Nitrospira sp.]
MTNSLLGVDAGDPQVAEDAHAPILESEALQRPSDVPEKFWDAERGELRADALVKSYVELERKLGGFAENAPPANPEDYQISVGSELVASDLEVNKRLHAAGFSQEQAQVVYDLAAERLPPMIAEVASMFEAETQLGH